MPVRRPAAALLLALAVLAAGCGEDETTSGGPTTSESPTTSATREPTASQTETPEPSETESPTPTAQLEDGRHFGSIRSIDVEAQTMRFDLAYFLTGEEANEAAAEHGDEVPVPNDYYIVNDNPRLRTLDVDPDVEVWVIDWADCCDVVEGEVQPFVDAFETRHHPWDAMYQGREAPYWITVEDGAVVKIEVQYLP
ncbi:MAG TPA: hypothetical protein VFT80_12675 [Actinomycetota bacterium]|nr:hypothetical protein [Actinomycetota bacterium]